jgi:hypothetical protein
VEAKAKAVVRSCTSIRPSIGGQFPAAETSSCKKKCIGFVSDRPRPIKNWNLEIATLRRHRTPGECSVDKP